MAASGPIIILPNGASETLSLEQKKQFDGILARQKNGEINIFGISALFPTRIEQDRFDAYAEQYWQKSEAQKDVPQSLINEVGIIKPYLPSRSLSQVIPAESSSPDCSDDLTESPPSALASCSSTTPIEQAVPTPVRTGARQRRFSRVPSLRTLSRIFKTN